MLHMAIILRTAQANEFVKMITDGTKELLKLEGIKTNAVNLQSHAGLPAFMTMTRSTALTPSNPVQRTFPLAKGTCPQGGFHSSFAGQEQRREGVARKR